MKIQYLGTAAAEGCPAIFCKCDICKKAKELGGKDIRTRSQAVIDDSLVIDLPPDSFHHMLTYGLDLPNTEHILFTHSHEDHLYELELALRCEGYAIGVDSVLHIYGNEPVKERYLANTSHYANGSNLRDVINVHVLTEFVPTPVGDYLVTPLLANHDKNEKCFIYIIEKNGQSLLYANDTGIFPDATWEYLKGKTFDLISLDCTTQKFKEGTNHMGIPDNIEVSARLREMGCMHENTKTVITHFSHNGQMLHSELEQAVAPYGFLVAYDGFSVSF